MPSHLRVGRLPPLSNACSVPPSLSGTDYSRASLPPFVPLSPIPIDHSDAIVVDSPHSTKANSSVDIPKRSTVELLPPLHAEAVPLCAADSVEVHSVHSPNNGGIDQEVDSPYPRNERTNIELVVLSSPI